MTPEDIFLSQRPEVDIPANYENLWLGDFETCLKTYSFEQVRLALIFSQLPRNQKYYVRSAGILKSLDSLIDQIEGVDDSAGVKRSLTVLWSQALKGQLPKPKTVAEQVREPAAQAFEKECPECGEVVAECTC